MENKTITITVKIGENEIYRDYQFDGDIAGESLEAWGTRVLDMLDTLEGSKKVKEF